MRRRAQRGTLLVVLGAVAAAACAPLPPPPPPPPPPALCQASPPPGPEDKVALIRDDATGEPDVVTFEAHTQAETNAEVAELDRTATVISVERDRPVAAAALDVDPSDDDLYVDQWGFTPSAVDFDPAWNVNAPPLDGTGVRVAVIDSGVQASHPDLTGNVIPGQDFVETTGVASNNATIDGYGHGTHVAGTIAAEDNDIGVVGGAPRAEILPVRVLNCDGTGTFAAVAQGIIWASDPMKGDADVLNLSLGGELPDPPPQFLTDAVNAARAEGAIVVASAGNCGDGTTCSEKNAVQYPAALDGVIAVGALDEGRSVPFTTPTAAADTPDSPENSLADPLGGEVDFVAHVQAASWTPAAPQALVSKLEPGVGGYEPLLLGSDGTLTFSWVDPLLATQSVVSTVPVGEPDGTRIWLRVTRDDALGEVTFFKAPDDDDLPTTWTPIGDPVSSAGTFADTAAPLTIGNDPALGKPFVGAVLYAELRDAIDGAPVNVFAPALQALGETSWESTSTLEEDWSLNGTTVTYRSAPYSNTNITVDVAAPGSAVISTYTDPDYEFLSGTSMSSPHVAALVALLVEKFEKCGLAATEASVLAALTENATAIGGFVNSVGLVKAGATTAAPC